MFVDLLFEVADFFCAAIFDADEADRSDWNPFTLNGGVGCLVDHGAGLCQQATDRFIDQWFPCLGTGHMAANHVLVIFFQYVRVLLIATSADEACSRTVQQRGEKHSSTLHGPQDSILWAQQLTPILPQDEGIDVLARLLRMKNTEKPRSGDRPFVQMSHAQG